MHEHPNPGEQDKLEERFWIYLRIGETEVVAGNLYLAFIQKDCFKRIAVSGSLVLVISLHVWAVEWL